MASRIFSTALRVNPLTDGTSTVFEEIDLSHHSDKDFIQLCQHPDYAHLSKIFIKGLGLRRTDFNPAQLAAMYAALEGSDVFAALPPGSGKSAIFQILGLHQKAKPGMTIVLTPLVSLIKDQLLSLNANGIVATGLWFGQDEVMRQATMDMLCGEVHPAFLYITPESFYSPHIHNLLMEMYDEGYIARLVFDEVQVVMEWKSFKEDYKKLQNLKKQFYQDGLQIILLSGSMGTLKAKEITSFLGISRCKLITKNPDRNNIFYTIQPKVPGCKGLPDNILDFLRRAKEANLSGIIYCHTPKECISIYNILCREGIDAGVFYGGDLEYPNFDKDSAHKRWQDNEVQIIIATIAFGLGINKNDVRFVIHFNLPKSLSHFIQETGRAGRDNKPALCILLYAYSDAIRNFNLFKNKNGSNIPMSDGQLYSEGIPDCLALVKMCEDHPLQCRRKFILNHYHMDAMEDSCGRCDNCTGEKTWTKMPVKIKHFIEVVLDTFRKQDNDITSSQLIDKVTDLPEEVEERVMEETRNYSILNGLDIEEKDLFKSKMWPYIVQKTVIHLILEGVLEERYIEPKQHFYVQRNNIPDHEVVKMMEDATVYLKIYPEDDA